MTARSPQPRHFVVAVDGPSGSGKSSTARAVAERLGWKYLDTGAMYRAITWWLISHGVDPDDSAAVATRAGEPQIEIGTNPDGSIVLIDGHDVTEAIRDSAVTDAVSAVSAVPEVRERMVAIQRSALDEGPIVIEGRDIGTVVVPDAPVKVFLNASARARAHRRSAELRENVNLEDTLVSMKRRDLLDSTRDLSPLLMAHDAVQIDSTDLTLDEVVDTIVVLVQQRLSDTVVE